MKLIIGLGNPGQKYEKNRHNIGFMAIDELKSNMLGFSEWSEDKAADAMVSNGETEGEKILLVKPQTFMNLSGQTVQKIAHFYKIQAPDIWVIHDDFDLPLGVLRVSRGASAAGHNGIQSIIEMLGTKDFVRLRLGIHPLGRSFFSVIFKRKIALEKFVLENFSKDEFKILDDVIKKCTLAIQMALDKGIEQAMNEFN